MKKLITLSVAVAALTISASDLFTGAWCVQDEGITLTFSGENAVEFSSADDETISGKGTFAFDDSTLTATLDNDGMIMEVAYNYTKVEENVEVTTRSLKVNGDTMESGDEVMTMVRCGEPEELSTEITLVEDSTNTDVAMDTMEKNKEIK